MIRLGCIATDAAAALEFGGVLAGAGLRISLAVPPGVPDAEADVVILLLSGPSPVAEAVSACDALLALGARQVVLVTSAGFDGDATAAVADALQHRLRAGFAPVLPGFPSRGRGVYQGHLFVGPNLAADANLPRRLAEGVAAPVGLIGFGIVEEGAGTIRREMSRLTEAGRRYAVIDAVKDDHLVAAAEAAASQALLIGGAGLALGLATGLPPNGRGIDPLPAPHGSWAVIAASGARTTLAQLGFARLHVPLLEPRSADELAEAAGPAASLLSDERPVVIAVDPAAATATAVGALVDALLARGVGRLLLAGEVLFGPVLGRFAALRVGAEIEPAVTVCAAGDPGPLIVFKPGSAGGRDILLRHLA